MIDMHRFHEERDRRVRAVFGMGRVALASIAVVLTIVVQLLTLAYAIKAGSGHH